MISGIVVEFEETSLIMVLRFIRSFMLYLLRTVT